MAFLRPYIGVGRQSSRTAHAIPGFHQAKHAVVCNNKSAIACCFRIVFGFDLGINIFIKLWIKDWEVERPPRPRHDPDEAGWDVGLIVQYCLLVLIMHS